MRLRILVSVLFLFATACSAPVSEPGQSPDGSLDDVGEINQATLPGGDVDDKRDAVPVDGLEVDITPPGENEEPQEELLMPQEPQEPEAPNLPDCLDAPGAAGCAGAPGV